MDEEDPTTTNTACLQEVNTALRPKTTTTIESTINTTTTPHTARSSILDVRSSITAVSSTINNTTASTTSFDSSSSSSSTSWRKDTSSSLSPKSNHHDHTAAAAANEIITIIVEQLPTVMLISILNLVVGIPFGASYFPIHWASSSSSSSSSSSDMLLHDAKDEDNDSSSSSSSSSSIDGVFPLPSKETLGLRMFLFATFIGQLVYTFKSKFSNPVSLQMIENVPFYHALALIVIEEQGYGKEALSTLFVIFGITSILVGIVFYLLGKLKLGKIVYYFPGHVLLGCIGGIGLFLLKTALEVTMNTTMTFTTEYFSALWNNIYLIRLVIVFEVALRVLQRFFPDNKLLSSLFYCAITPVFYLGLYLFGINFESAEEDGYLFPQIVDSSGASGFWKNTFFNVHVFDLWTIMNINSVSWVALLKCLPTMASLIAFSLIHVPINIPAFAVSTDVEADMNNELIAHGYSNGLSGIFGGIQNYMGYSNSVIYAKCGGRGKVPSLLICFVTVILFFVGPSIAVYIPRCMAGVVLVHVGVDLVMEAAYDSIGKLDCYETASVWVITATMALFGMTMSLIVGLVSAMMTYAAQSIHHLEPIRMLIDASSLRGSNWNRPYEALEILEDDISGRKRILLVQLQGHLFFGNIVVLNEQIQNTLKSLQSKKDYPLIVIVDFSLVVALDSSACQTIVKLRRSMHRRYGVEVTIFVTGSDEGFPCEYGLSKALDDLPQSDYHLVNVADTSPTHYLANEETSLIGTCRDSSVYTPMSVTITRNTLSQETLFLTNSLLKKSVCTTLDEALVLAENILIARKRPALVEMEEYRNRSSSSGQPLTLEDEALRVKRYLRNLCKGCTDKDAEGFFSLLQREEYSCAEFEGLVWSQGSKCEKAILLIEGTFVSTINGLNGEDEIVSKGNFVGELCLVNEGLKRLTTVKCLSSHAIGYVLTRKNWIKMVEHHPHLANIMNQIAIRYMTHRIQHVRNRVLEAHLPA